MDEKTKFKTWFDEETGILRSEIYKTFDPDTATSYFDDIAENFSEDQQRYYLAFLGEDAQEIISKETRRISRDKAKQINWNKIAIYGAKPGLRMIAKIIMKAIGKGKDTKFFETKKECLDWLKVEIENTKKPNTNN